MFWFYERRDERLRVETRLDKIDGSFLLGIVWPDGHEQRERFLGEEAFRRRLLELEDSLGSDAWVRREGPVVSTDAPADRAGGPVAAAGVEDEPQKPT